MNLALWNPANDLERFFDDAWRAPSFPKLGPDLAVDVFEEGKNIVAKCSLPGVKAEELDVSIDKDILTISGSREEEKEVNKKNYYSKEIRRGSFARSVRLPSAVEAGAVKARYEDGVLTITAPIEKGHERKAVKVKIAGK